MSTPLPPDAPASGARIGGDQARALLEAGARLLDVRTPAEFAAGHLPGADNVPIQALPAQLGSFPRDQPLVVYCRSGARSGAATRMLRGAGVGYVVDLGPMHAWSAAGPPRQALSSLLLPAVASVTLGLAPLWPEPHLIGKLRWVAGGAVGMSLVDWGDLVMHGAPWVWLLVSVARVVRGQLAPAP